MNTLKSMSINSLFKIVDAIELLMRINPEGLPVELAGLHKLTTEEIERRSNHGDYSVNAG